MTLDKFCCRRNYFRDLMRPPWRVQIAVAALFREHECVGAKDPLLKILAELQIRIMQLEREGSPPPSLRLAQAKLSRNSKQVALGRIRQFESYMPSHAVVSNSRSPDMRTARRYCSRSRAWRRV